jgi:hypothetical protein
VHAEGEGVGRDLRPTDAVGRRYERASRERLLRSRLLGLWELKTLLWLNTACGQQRQISPGDIPTQDSTRKRHIPNEDRIMTLPSRIPSIFAIETLACWAEALPAFPVRRLLIVSLRHLICAILRAPPAAAKR